MSSMNPPWEAGWPVAPVTRTAVTVGQARAPVLPRHTWVRLRNHRRSPPTRWAAAVAAEARFGVAWPAASAPAVPVSARAARPADSPDAAGAADDAPRAVTCAAPSSPWSRSSRGTATRSSRRSASGAAASGAPARGRSTHGPQLEDEGLVRIEKVEGRRVIHLTDAGTKHVEEHRAELDAVWEAVGRDVDDDAAALWEQLSQLHAAAHQVMSAGTSEQIAAAGAALAEARKTSSRLLAGRGPAQCLEGPLHVARRHEGGLPGVHGARSHGRRRLRHSASKARKGRTTTPSSANFRRASRRVDRTATTANAHTTYCTVHATRNASGV